MYLTDQLLETLNLPNHSYKHMAVCGIMVIQKAP